MGILVVYIENHKNASIEVLCQDYIKKTQGNFALKAIPLPSSKVTDPKKQQEIETAAVLKQCKASDKLILCDERGSIYNSVQFSTFVANELANSRGNLIFAIGGAYGFTQEVLQSHVTLKLSEFVMPHQIAKLVLIEQLYRAFQIQKGTGYHHT
jgi:23S rRNA (pseudouridine1915-N3)-methyltransferase